MDYESSAICTWSRVRTCLTSCWVIQKASAPVVCKMPMPQKTRLFRTTRHNVVQKRGKDIIPFAEWQLVDKICMQFRFHPYFQENTNDARMTFLESARGDSADGFETINTFEMFRSSRCASIISRANSEAKAWISVVLSELEARNTENFRLKFFNGPFGRRTKPQNQDSVRERLRLTFNFVEKELQQGIHYVYPAVKHCERNIAYVYRPYGRRLTEGFSPTNQRHVQCHPSEVYSKPCAFDPDGKYYVYLCKYFFEERQDGGQIATIVHEVVHHSGPTDVRIKTSS